MNSEEIKSTFQYDPTTGVITRDGKPTGSVLPNGYLYLSLRKKRLLAHRVIWLLVTGAWPSKEIDHANRNRTDNRWSNLREATRRQNACNQITRRNSRSGFRGVSWHTRVGKWRAVIQDHGRQRHLGYFKYKEAAAETYRKAAKTIHGKFHTDP